MYSTKIFFKNEYFSGFGCFLDSHSLPFFQGKKESPQAFLEKGIIEETELEALV
jgi:hypothetical protein